MYWVTGILGFALLIAPFIFSYTNNLPAAWTSYAIGGVVAIVSVVEGFAKDRDMWEYWTAEILGLGAVIAPFIFGFSGHAVATWTSVVLGVLLALMAGSRLYIGKSQ